MKKSTAKPSTAKTSAPVAKTEVVAKRTAKKPVAVEKKTPPAPAAPVAKSVAKASAVKVSKAPKATKPKVVVAKASAKAAAVTTTIVAAVDVGFGNHLTLRGEGAGLSWESGVPLECSADDRWVISLPETSHPIICKFLINDETWCAGEDYTVLPGSNVVLSPSF